MLKKYILFPVLVSCFVLGGCGNTDKQTPQEQVVKEQPVVPKKEEAVSVPSVSEQKTISKEEQEFNASGRAKAVDNEANAWPLFEDKKTGFSLHYPMNTILVDDSNFVLGSEMPQVKVWVREIGAMDIPWDLTTEDALGNIEVLAGGKFGKSNENLLEASKKVAMAGNLFAQDFMVLSRLDVCNVTVERKRLFYFNNKQIEITAYASIPKVKKLMPEYFITDKQNCGTDKVWDLKKHDQFYSQLEDKKAPAEIQAWYDNFEKMMDTIELAHK